MCVSPGVIWPSEASSYSFEEQCNNASSLSWASQLLLCLPWQPSEVEDGRRAARCPLSQCHTVCVLFWAHVFLNLCLQFLDGRWWAWQKGMAAILKLRIFFLTYSKLALFYLAFCMWSLLENHYQCWTFYTALQFTVFPSIFPSCQPFPAIIGGSLWCKWEHCSRRRRLALQKGLSIGVELWDSVPSRLWAGQRAASLSLLLLFWEKEAELHGESRE